MTYQIYHHRLFEKELLTLPAHLQQKVFLLATRLSQAPHQLPPNTTSLKGYKYVFRTRLGNFRLIYHLDHARKRVTLLGIQSRGQIYKTLKK